MTENWLIGPSADQWGVSFDDFVALAEREIESESVGMSPLYRSHWLLWKFNEFLNSVTREMRTGWQIYSIFTLTQMQEALLGIVAHARADEMRRGLRAGRGALAGVRADWSAPLQPSERLHTGDEFWVQAGTFARGWGSILSSMGMGDVLELPAESVQGAVLTLKRLRAPSAALGNSRILLARPDVSDTLRLFSPDNFTLTTIRRKNFPCFDISKAAGDLRLAGFDIFRRPESIAKEMADVQARWGRREIKKGVENLTKDAFARMRPVGPVEWGAFQECFALPEAKTHGPYEDVRRHPYYWLLAFGGEFAKVHRLICLLLANGGDWRALDVKDSDMWGDLVAYWWLFARSIEIALGIPVLTSMYRRWFDPVERIQSDQEFFWTLRSVEFDIPEVEDFFDPNLERPFVADLPKMFNDVFQGIKGLAEYCLRKQKSRKVESLHDILRYWLQHAMIQYSKFGQVTAGGRYRFGMLMNMYLLEALAHHMNVEPSSGWLEGLSATSALQLEFHEKDVRLFPWFAENFQFSDPGTHFGLRQLMLKKR